MACDISKGRASLPCKDDVAGLKAIYVSNYEDFGTADFTTTVGASGGYLVTAIANPDTKDWFKFELKGSGNTFSQDITSSVDNGTTFVTQVINFVLPKLSSELNFQLMMMAYGHPRIVLESYSGNYWLMGLENGCEITASKGEIQGTKGALSGTTSTATAEEKYPVYKLSVEAVADLLSYVSTSDVN